MRHIIGAEQFTRRTLDELMKSARSFEKGKQNIIKDKILATLFYEPSTRTRLSFESAFIRLGGSVISTENAKEFSSAAKGETVEDTMRVINHYADVAVIRHCDAGMVARAAAVASIPVINAGDGPGQHPTQSLLDLYTIYRELGHLDNLHLTLVGDLKHGRTVRSLCYLLGNYTNISLTFVSPPELAMNDDIKTHLSEQGITFHETTSLEDGIKDADVVYMTRVQKERFRSDEEYQALKGRYVLTRALVDSMKEKSIIMHPLPRVDEIQEAVDTSPKAVYFKQAAYGVYMRMAILKYVLE